MKGREKYQSNKNNRLLTAILSIIILKIILHNQIIIVLYKVVKILILNNRAKGKTENNLKEEIYNLILDPENNLVFLIKKILKNQILKLWNLV